MSALGETVFATALTGARAQVMGDPDQPHSYYYTPDVATALVDPGNRSRGRREGPAPAGGSRSARPDRSSTTCTAWPVIRQGAP